ncbi:MAG: M23 family metallopeptidase [Lachnospiraceae bacterium]|nr:M23 family metallopeptidase [Lachnospiraceae bacterium]
MRFLTKYTKTMKFSHIGAMLVTALLVFMVVPALPRFSEDKNNLFSVFVDGNLCGRVSDPAVIDGMLIEARRRLAKEQSGLVMVDYDLTVSGSREIFGQEDDPEMVTDNIYRVFSENVAKTKQPVYEIKINEFTVNLRSSEEVLELLKQAKSKYDDNNEYTVEIVLDPTRELNVLTTHVVKTAELAKEQEEELFPSAGAIKRMNQMYEEAKNQTLEGFDFGVKSLDFGENVEVVRAYVDADQITSLDDAIAEVTKKEEKDTIYEVVAGDSLSVIAEKNGTTVENIIAMNHEIIPNQNALIRPGDEIKVMVPKPELSVVRTEEIYYEENYEAEVQYIDNDEWYTNHQEIRQEPRAGFRKVVADIIYRNDDAESKNIIYEDIVAEAVPKIIERGTQIPPTFLKPISGGRLTSRFGKRKAPTRGASTYHKGVDWSTPVGTSVVASSGGTVIRAGWGGGYGYCVYIEHPDGKVTRYGHLSKVLVKAGQTVNQGEKIALSGNTGVSTGPHLHFEILVNGAQVNPLNYL